MGRYILLSVSYPIMARLRQNTTSIIKNRFLSKSSTTKNNAEDTTINIKSFCRRRRERVDSVTLQMINERILFQERIQDIQVSRDSVLNLIKAGFGTRRKLPTVYSSVYASSGSRITNTAAGGFATFVAAASKNWPIFQHMLPEIAFAGHSNCGKSTLVNAMIGSSTNKGTASVSDRAGWTDQICFYQIGKRPPVMTIADLPGYGHAVASVDDRKEWMAMTKDYVSGDRLILSRCCVLVDSSRGLCIDDMKMIKYLIKSNTPWQIILTKADLLSVQELAQAIEAVRIDAIQSLGLQEVIISPVSSSTGAGVHDLWRELMKAVDEVALPAPLGAVREHVKAAAVKRRAASAMFLSKQDKQTRDKVLNKVK